MREYMLGRSWEILLNLWQQSSPLSAHFSTTEALWKCSWRMWGKVLDCVVLPSYLSAHERMPPSACCQRSNWAALWILMRCFRCVSSSLACRQTQEVILSHFPPCRCSFKSYLLKLAHASESQTGWVKTLLQHTCMEGVCSKSCVLVLEDMSHSTYCKQQWANAVNYWIV